MSSEGSGRRVLLGGWYGAANLGDEMIFATFVRWVREAGAEPLAISVHPALTRREHGVAAVGYGDLPAIAEALAGADAFVLGGGGLFQDYEPFDRASLARFPAWNVAQFAQFARLAAELRVPVGVLAQGVGPLRGDEARAIAAEVFALARVASVRDAGSAALLAALGVRRDVAVAPDPAWTLVPSRIDVATRFPDLAGRRVLAIVVRDWPFDRSWEAPFVHALRTALQPGWACLWLDFARLPDAACETAANDEIAGRLALQVPGVTHAIWRGLRLDEAAGLIAGSDALVAMRLHAALLGHAAALPVVTLEYDAKVRALGDEAQVPAASRMGLGDVAGRLPATLAGVQRADAFRLPARTRDALARNALVHRDLLRSLLAAERREAASALPALLPGWRSALDGEGRARLDAACARARSRSPCA
ncbi:MAG TPA: polysaccharide pyruvyl transferase family protein [Casimicrobiaceae bacterium]|nr:polysaccharide pyruvyl transferase family protein [Casimicrobiaceae bacterium]